MADAFENAWNVSKEFYVEQQDYEQPYREGRRNRRTGKVAKKPSRDIRGMRTARRHGYNVSDRNYRGDADAGQWATSVPQKGRRLSDAWNPNLSSEDEQARRDWRAVNLSRYGGLSEEDAIPAVRDKLTHEAMHTALELPLNEYNRSKGRIYTDAAHELGAVTGEVSARNDRSPDAVRRLLNQMHPIKRPVPASKRTRALRNIARKNPLLRAIGRRITKGSKDIYDFLDAPIIMKERKKLNWYSEYDGLGGSKLMNHKKLGLAGYGTAAKKRGHNVQSFDWGLREDGTDAEFKQGDEDYHIKDIMRGSVKNQVDEILDAFDGEVIDFMSAGTPCKAFSIGGQNVAWKVNEPSMRYFWNKVRPNQDFPELTEKDVVENPSLTPALAAWGKGSPKNRKSIKGHLASIRSKHGEGMGKKWGKTIFEPKSIDEIMYDIFGNERMVRGKPITEEAAKKMKENTELGLSLMNRTGDITNELYRRGMLGHHMIENPRAKMRYMNELSHMPVLETTGASYRNPAHSQLFGLKPEPNEFDMGEYLRRRIAETNQNRKNPKPIPEGLPPAKATDLIANLPSNFEIRPFLGQEYGGKLYEKGPRGSSSSIQGMPGMPKDYLYPGSPRIDAFHARSLAPYQMGNDIIHALEEFHGIHPGDENPNDVIRRFKQKDRIPTLKDFQETLRRNVYSYIP